MPLAGTVKTSAIVLLEASYLINSRLFKFPEIGVTVIVNIG